MPSSPPVVRCLDVVKTYRTATSEIRALRGISGEFPGGALTAVWGPSGSGKSTLLRVVSGMDRPTSGAVQVEGTSVGRASSRVLRGLRRRTIGYGFQRPSDNFLPHLTVGEHLWLAARDVGEGEPISTGELLDELGLADRVDHLPDALSGGEQQRAAFAQVLAAGARIVVTDEPTAELDSESARGVVEAMRRLVGSGVAFIVATHDPALRRAADEVVELEHGRSKGDTGFGPAVKRPADRWIGSSAGGSRWGRPNGPGVPEGEVVLEVRGVDKTYHRGGEIVHAVRDVSVTVVDGELAGLVGRSGSGKTTLLNVIGGWEDPDAGTVRYDSTSVHRRVPRWDEVAVLPQKFGLLDELTVRENVEYPARLAGRLFETRDHVDELIERLGLLELQSRYPKETSVGEQQRMALARALALSPRVLLADEPTGHQDERSTRAVLSVLRSAAARGTACLVATHNEAVSRYLDRVLAMSDGRIAASPSS